MYKSTLIAFVSLFSTICLKAQESKELDLVIKSELNREFHTTIEGKGDITLNLTFSEEELGVDPCYSMLHAVRSVQGWYSFDSTPDERVNFSGGALILDTIYLYVGVNGKGDSGLRCGKWIDFENGGQEIEFTERFMFTGSGSNEWFDNKTVSPVNPIFSSQDVLVEQFIYVSMEDGTKLDLMPIIVDHHGDLLYPYSHLYYKKCFATDEVINVLLVKYNEYSCWNEYQEMIHLSFDKKTLELIDSKRYQISKCDKLACSFMDSAHEDNKIYDIYSYGSSGGTEIKEVLVGQFKIEKAKVHIMKKWF
jgi:hypothetical protein